jgi:tetratricopeptide (TPR) repeat protein
MWELSAQSWREAVADNAYLAQAATFSLMPVPPATRAAVRRILGAPPALVAPRKVLAALDLAWGSPRDGWDALHALTPDTAALAAWTDFAQHAEEAGAWLVARDALIAIGRHQTSPEIVARAAGDAIRGGDALSAVALAQAAEQRLDSATAASTVVPTHLEALSTLGRAADGERLVSAYGAKLSPDQKQRLLRTLAWGWIRAGDVGKARALMAQAGEGGDAAAIGWIALYDGDLATARKRLKPTPDASPDLISALALLSRTKADSAPVAGRAFLTLARGDTIAAAGSFEAAAKQLPDAAPLLLARAARLYESRHDDAKAIALWQSIVAGAPDAPEAPEAELEWARSLRRTGQNALAVQRLEHLILTWPQSALVPQARRELELAKQTVPSAS